MPNYAFTGGRHYDLVILRNALGEYCKHGVYCEGERMRAYERYGLPVVRGAGRSHGNFRPFSRPQPATAGRRGSGRALIKAYCAIDSSSRTCIIRMLLIHAWPSKSRATTQWVGSTCFPVCRPSLRHCLALKRDCAIRTSGMSLQKLSQLQQA